MIRQEAVDDAVAARSTTRARPRIRTGEFGGYAVLALLSLVTWYKLFREVPATEYASDEDN